MATRRWQLWVDRGGGYEILQGTRLSIGGPGGDDLADLIVRCRCSRRAATLVRSAHGDAIIPGEADSNREPEMGARAHPLGNDQQWSLGGAAGQPAPTLRYQRPSPLSGSAVLTVKPPHRFHQPIDAVILFDQTILLGPEPFNHVRVPALSSQGWVLMRRDDQWWIRSAHLAAQPLRTAEHWQHEDWSLMIKEA